MPVGRSAALALHALYTYVLLLKMSGTPADINRDVRDGNTGSDDLRHRSASSASGSSSSNNNNNNDDDEKKSALADDIGTMSAITSDADGDASRKKSTVEVPRTITLLGGISFIVGTIIGSGIFISPKGVARRSGSIGMTMMSWVICGVISIIGAFCYAELGTVIKESGADYIYLHYSYGGFVSFIFSWVNNLLVKPASQATITLTCATYIMVLFFGDDCGDAPVLIQKLLAIFIMFILVAINTYSLKLANRIQIIFTIAKIVGLAIIIIGGIVKLFQGYTEYLATGFEGTETNPGIIALGLYSGMWSYDGWNTANFMTEEIINPSRNLPLAIVIGVPLTMVIYIMTNISYFTVMSLPDLLASPAVAITWAERVMPSVVWLIPIFVALSTFGTGNGSLYSGGRLMFVAARNEHLPDVLAMVHAKKFTPVPAIALTLILAIVFIIPGDIGQLIDFIGFLSWIFYGMNFLGVIIFRYKKEYKDLPRPVKIPLVLPVLALLSAVFLVIGPIVADPQAGFLFAVALIIVGGLVWIPLVHFRFRFKFMLKVTMFFQLYFQVMRPRATEL